MKKKTIDKAATALLTTIGIFAITAFGCWRADVNSPSETLEQYLAKRRAEDISIEESIAAEQTETASVAKMLEDYIESISAEPTMAERTSEVATAEPTTAETTTAEPTEATETSPDTSTATETTEMSASEATPTTSETISQNVSKPILSQADEHWLLRVASCEAGNQGVVGIALVMRVIINRSIVYNMTIQDVVFAPRQFSVIGMPLFESGYIADDAWTALEAIKNGWDESQGALFFCAPRANSWHRSAKTFLFQYGGHEFYK